ncbi:SPFH domain-containing protein [Streptomyces sp. NBC_00048]|uniref:SPFH domain-containing protein n=1 Tax=Streptomyces sp. NBC_00048 TaxID=2975628 RepID=UPI0032523DD3
MYPTRTTSTTGTLRVPAAAPPVAPVAPAAPAEPAYGPVRQAPAPVRGVAAPRGAAGPSAPPALVGAAVAAQPEPVAAAETSTGWAFVPAVRTVEEAVLPLPQGLDVPAARAQAEPEQVHTGLGIPHPQDEAAHAGVATLRLRITDAEAAVAHPREAGPEPTKPAPAWPTPTKPAPTKPAPTKPAPTKPAPTKPAPAWPAPTKPAPVRPAAVVEPEPEPEHASEAEPEPDPEPGSEHPAVRSGVPGPGVAEIVAHAVARGLEQPAPDDTHGVPRFGRQRGTAVTEVPVHLPFHGEPNRGPARARDSAPAAGARRGAPRPAPGRRVPRGDDRLREHRGPVLPGWIGVGVGGLALAGCAAVLWRAGVVPPVLVAAFGGTPRAYQGLRATHWPPLAFLGIVALLALGGLGRIRTGHAWVLTLFGRYRGTVRRTGLTWVSPLLLRRRVDVRLRHWRSEPMPAVDSGGLALQVVVQVVWQVKDTARATLAVEDHVEYLAEQVESAMARVLSQLPADAFHEDAPTLRDAEAVGDALTRMLAAETEAVGIEVFSAQPTRIEYAAEVAEAMRRRRVAAIDAKHRDTVLTSVVDAVDDTVHRLTSRGLVELDDYERKALVKDLTVAFYTGRSE